MNLHRSQESPAAAAGDPSPSSYWVLCGVLALYLLCVIGQSLHKLIWGDELFTLYIAQTGSLRTIWGALVAGADPNPPLIHASVLLSTRLFGVSPLAMRLPSIVFVGVALVSMWSILRRWVSPACAAAGLLAFMATRGFDYSYDARSYAPMLGFAMLSLAFWVAAETRSGPGRLGLLAGMTLALAAGLCSNYYCVLAFFPVAAGQLARDLSQRRATVSVWLALLLASLPLFALLPLIRHNISEFAPHAWNRPRPSMIMLSYLELVEGILWPVLIAGVFALRHRAPAPEPPVPFRAALATLLVYPFLAYLIAIEGAEMISPRCVAPLCCGVGMLAGLVSFRLFGQSRRAMHLVLGALVLWVVVRESFCAVLLLQQRHAFFALRDTAERLDQNRPILIADSSLVLPLYFYSERGFAHRIVFPIDFTAIHRFQPDDSGEQNLWAGRYGVFPFPVLPYTPPATGTRALVIARPDGWLAHSLQESGATLQPGPDTPAWDHAGGVFTPMTHPETRFLFLSR